MQEGVVNTPYKEARAVVIRAYAGQPLYRLLLSYTDEAAFVCAEEYLDAILAGTHPSPMVGFPMKDVFEFDEAAFAALAEQWTRQRETDPAMWRKLKPYAVRASRG
jgi:hypothetical protein